MATDVLCEVCGEGHVVPLQGSNEVEYKGKQYAVPFRMSYCDACGSEFGSPADMRANKRAVIELQKQVDGLLEGHAIRHIRAMYKLSQEEAGRVFGGGPVAFSKYESNDIAQSTAMDNLLRAAQQIPGVVHFLAKRACVDIKPAEMQIASNVAKVKVVPPTESRFSDLVLVKKIRQCNYQPVAYSFSADDILDLAIGEPLAVAEVSVPFQPRTVNSHHIETKTLTFNTRGFSTKRQGRFAPKPRHKHSHQ